MLVLASTRQPLNNNNHVHAQARGETLNDCYFLFIVEDRNFALFNFVNEQNNEAEALREQIHQVSRKEPVISLYFREVGFGFCFEKCHHCFRIFLC
jgi:hypothetical protein